MTPSALTSDTTYLSPNELRQRWRCGRSTVDRIARRAGLTRLCLGNGQRGLVRYRRDEVEKLEASRQTRMT